MKRSIALVQGSALEVIIEGENPVLLERVQDVFSGSVPRYREMGAEGTTVRIQVAGPERVNGGDFFKVGLNGRDVFSAESEDKLLNRIEGIITRLLLHSLKDWHLFHAGAAALDGRGIIFPGPCGAGKSTLAAALALAGFQYLSDEVAVVGGNGLLHPFPKVISLEEEGLRCIYEYSPQGARQALVHTSAGAGRWYLKPPRLYRNGKEGPSVDYIFMLHRRVTGGPLLQPVPKARAVAELVEQHMTLSYARSHGVDLVVRLVRGAQCYALNTSQLHQAVRALEGLIRGSPTTG